MAIVIGVVGSADLYLFTVGYIVVGSVVKWLSLLATLSCSLQNESFAPF